MNRKTSSTDIAGNTWHLLGQLEITIGPAPDLSIWLMGIFSDLNLRADLLDKIVRSAEEGVSKALQARAVERLEHLHLFIFVPVSRVLNNHNWGFYRIEKIETPAGKAKPDHSIEFYLYQDGK